MVAIDRRDLSRRSTRKEGLCKDFGYVLTPWLRPERICALERLIKVLVLSVAVQGAFAQPALGAGQSFGILGEYFLENPNTCRAGNGSFGVFDHLVPNVTRRDAVVYWPNRLSLRMKRCSWQQNVFGNLKHSCAGNDVTTQNMAVRWTGYLFVITGGLYEFEMEVDDGARLTIGHGRCPSITCGSFVDTMNVDLRNQGMLQTSSQGAAANQVTYTYAKQCQLCATGVYGDCFVTSNGCEPFSAWTLEADGATKANPGTCNHVGAARTYRGSKYLQPGQHPFKLEYFNRGGDAKAILRWKGPDSGNVMSVIEQYSFVYPKFDGLKAEWFEMPVPQQGDTDIRLGRYVSPMGDIIGGHRIKYQDYALQDVIPQRAAFGQANTFSDLIAAQTRITVVRFMGWLRILTAGRYDFRLESDDGSRFVLGGQGTRKERVVVDNDGEKERLLESTGYADILAGQHSIRLEFLHIPGYMGVLPSPPGLIFQYKGPDTGGAWKDVQSKGFSALQATNSACALTSWEWSQGSQYTTDCSGECFDTRVDFLGDGKCDGGSSTNQPVLNLQCSQWNFDNNDCVPVYPPDVTTRSPGASCYVSCPAGDWKRNSCAQCLGEVLNGACVYSQERAPDCIPTQSNPDKCNYRECCTAKLDNIVGWGTDCIQFGAATNCTHALQQILIKQRAAPLSLYETALYVTSPNAPARPVVDGAVLSRETIPLINTITDAFVKNPYTGFDTTERVCPVGESANPGVECFDGPWELTGVQDPLKECQGGAFADNFCVNRKTTKGLPMATCCTFAWMDSKGAQQCRFLGIPFGTCADYVKAYQDSVSVNSFTAITAPIVIFQCTGNRCNNARTDTDAGNVGCPSVLNTEPWQTELLRTRAPGAPLSDDLLYANAKPATPEEFNPTLVICIVGGVVALCVAAVVTHIAMQRPPPPTWHSAKAIVVSNDTWIEPHMDQNTGKEFGIVAPRTFAFLSVQQHAKPKIVPKALRIDPYEVAVAEEAVEGAVKKQLRFEDDIRNCRDHKFLPEEELRHAALEDVKKSHLQLQLEERQAVPAELRDHSVPHLPQVVHMPDPFKDRTWALKDEDDVDDEDDLGSDEDGSNRGSKRPRAASKDPRQASKTPADWRRGSAILKTGAITYALPDSADVESSVSESAPESLAMDPRLEQEGFTQSAVTSKPPAAARYERKGKGKGAIGLICT